jgi:G3E family GTPase
MTGKLPLHVLTGFLGSGKTTLLNRMLREPALADSAVLINEIGAIAIDHHLVRETTHGSAIDIVVLKGGCTCCTVRGDLVEALRELFTRRADSTVPAFGRVILETTGLADPTPVLFTLAADPVLRHRFTAGTVLTTVDAVHGLRQLARHPECRKQVAVADRLIVTKRDLAEPNEVAQLTTELTRLNPAAEILDPQALDPLEPLLAARPIGDAPAHNLCNQATMPAEHSGDIAALALTLDRPIEWSPFAVWLSLLLHAHGENVLRFKALLDVAGWSGPVALDGIHHLIHPPIHLAAWPEGPRLSCIVIIAQGLPMNRIERSLRDFLTRHAQNREPTVAALERP